MARPPHVLKASLRDLSSFCEASSQSLELQAFRYWDGPKPPGTWEEMLIDLASRGGLGDGYESASEAERDSRRMWAANELLRRDPESISADSPFATEFVKTVFPELYEQSLRCRTPPSGEPGGWLCRKYGKRLSGAIAFLWPGLEASYLGLSTPVPHPFFARQLKRLAWQILNRLPAQPGHSAVQLMDHLMYLYDRPQDQYHPLAVDFLARLLSAYCERIPSKRPGSTASRPAIAARPDGATLESLFGSDIAPIAQRLWFTVQLLFLWQQLGETPDSSLPPARREQIYDLAALKCGDICDWDYWLGLQDVRERSKKKLAPKEPTSIHDGDCGLGSQDDEPTCDGDCGLDSQDDEPTCDGDCGLDSQDVRERSKKQLAPKEPTLGSTAANDRDWHGVMIGGEVRKIALNMGRKMHQDFDEMLGEVLHCLDAHKPFQEKFDIMLFRRNPLPFVRRALRWATQDAANDIPDSKTVREIWKDSPRPRPKNATIRGWILAGRLLPSYSESDIYAVTMAGAARIRYRQHSHNNKWTLRQYVEDWHQQNPGKSRSYDTALRIAKRLGFPMSEENGSFIVDNRPTIARKPLDDAMGKVRRYKRKKRPIGRPKKAITG